MQKIVEFFSSKKKSIKAKQKEIEERLQQNERAANHFKDKIQVMGDGAMGALSRGVAKNDQ